MAITHVNLPSSKLSELSDGEAFEFYRTFLEWYCQWHRPKYLEIGCHTGGLTARLSKFCEIATGVDIRRYSDWITYLNQYSNLRLVKASSDTYFRAVDDKYDLIFIDGDHSAKQVLKDTENALRILNEEGLIVLHDSKPPSARYKRLDACGTVFKAVEKLRKDESLQVLTLPVRFGLTLISRVN